MHGLIWWALIGLLAGILAKALTPGAEREPKGCLMTMVLGIAGSLLVGFLMRALLGDQGQGGFIATLIGATIGAMLLIFLMRRFWK